MPNWLVTARLWTGCGGAVIARHARWAAGLVMGKIFPVGSVLAMGLQCSATLPIAGVKPAGLSAFFSVTAGGTLNPVPLAR